MLYFKKHKLINLNFLDWLQKIWEGQVRRTYCLALRTGGPPPPQGKLSPLLVLKALAIRGQSASAGTAPQGAETLAPRQPRAPQPGPDWAVLPSWEGPARTHQLQPAACCRASYLMLSQFGVTDSPTLMGLQPRPYTQITSDFGSVPKCLGKSLQMGPKGREQGLPAGFLSPGFIVGEEIHPGRRLGRQEGSPQSLLQTNPTLRDSIRWGLQYEQQGSHLEGRKGELQAGIHKGQVASRVALF